MPLFARAALALLALPGTIAFLIPLLLMWRSSQPFDAFLGMFPLTFGTALVLWCVREFYVVGKGTLAPWEPPRELVVSGPYRVSRNPSYIGVALILIGWTLAFRSPLLLLYALIVVYGFHLRIVIGEEPSLARRFGEEWESYRSHVPRWIRLRLRPRSEARDEA